MPFPLRLSQHLDGARERVVAWARSIGLLDEGVWTERDLRDIDLPLCAAGIHPAASPDELDISSTWLTWGTYGDDYYPIRFGRGDLAGARACTERLKGLLGPAPAEVPANALERGLLDAWQRTAGPMTETARATFRAAIVRMLDAWLWELDNHDANRIPDPVDYVEMRRQTFGSDLTMSLARLAHGQSVPQEVYRTRPVQSLENAAMDYAALVNDVYSYRKEIEFEGELHNAVLVTRAFLGVDTDRAFAIVADLITSRIKQFEHVLAEELPPVLDGLPAAARAAVLAYVEELKDWMAGILNWHHHCRRYEDAALRYRPVPRFAPNGLGTSAARLALR
jgi:germacradienol/geosmin synthase